MAEPVTASDVATHAAKKQEDFNARKRARVEGPTFAGDKGESSQNLFKGLQERHILGSDKVVRDNLPCFDFS